LQEFDDGQWPGQAQNVITHDNISEARHLIEDNCQVTLNGLTMVLKMNVSSVLNVVK
jgi:hypothetical protein